MSSSMDCWCVAEEAELQQSAKFGVTKTLLERGEN